MTLAMQKIVQAMDVELKRQAEQTGGHADQDVLGHAISNARQLHGTFDLEKVARAALLAAREPDAEVVDLVSRIIFVKVDNTLHAPEAPSIQAAAREMMPRVIDAILGEQP